MANLNIKDRTDGVERKVSISVHASQRMAQRGVCQADLADTLARGVVVQGHHGRLKATLTRNRKTFNIIYKELRYDIIVVTAIRK